MVAMKLSGKAFYRAPAEPCLARVESLTDLSGLLRIIGSDDRKSLRVALPGNEPPDADVVLHSDQAYVEPGDILRLDGRNSEVRVLYRRRSSHNFLFFTERCNSRCLMCSQPPREIDDAYLVDDILKMIPWMAADTPELGITGGEPTLLGERMLQVIASVRDHLPQTALHMLSNGRLFSRPELVRAVGSIGHPDFMVGIPLYADTAAPHDFVVQAEGAFRETILGLVNLGSEGVRIELRLVLHSFTVKRLPQFARYVVRNLPFVDQIAFMGLELMGFAKSNLNALWIEPADYVEPLAEALEILDQANLTALVYNLPLCLLPESVRPFARKSISDWKNIYLPECDRCSLRSSCAGFFASTPLRVAKGIRAFP